MTAAGAIGVSLNGQGLFTPEEYQPFGTAVLMAFSFWENNYSYQDDRRRPARGTQGKHDIT